MENSQRNSQDWTSASLSELTPSTTSSFADAASMTFGQSPFVSSSFGGLSPFTANAHGAGFFNDREIGEARAVPETPANNFGRWFKDAPWNPQQVNGLSPTSNLAPPFIPVREPLRSDTSSVVTGRQDSEYITKPSTYSVASTEPTSPGQDCPEILNAFDNLHPFARSNRPRDSLDVPSNVSHSPASSPTRVRSQEHPCQCPHCSETFRLKSELKKHVLKHQRPFLCDYSSCSYATSGFTSRNDLERHQKTIHGAFTATAGQKYYICAAESCAGKPRKVWPRPDNFRAHVARVHKYEDKEALIKRSEHIMTNPSDLTLESVQGGHGGSFDAAVTSSQQKLGQTQENLPQRHISDRSRRAIQIDQFSSPTSLQMENTCVSRAGQRSVGRSEPQRRPPPASFATPGVVSSIYSNPNSFEVTRNAGSSPGISETALLSKPKVVNHQRRLQDEELKEFSSALAAQCNDKPPEVPLADAIYQFLEERMAQKSKNQSIARSSYPDLREFKAPYQPGRAYSTVSRSRPTAQQIDSAVEVNSPRSDGSGGTRSKAQKDGQHQPSKLHSGVKCSTCSKILRRSCDLKKHMRRHTRPFGCTFDSCYKTFGSKNDWKRHENSQHLQADCWRCEELISDGKQDSRDQVCGMVFYRREPFGAHLARKHNIMEQARIADECKRRRIGVHGQESFWCGFCRSKQPLQGRGLQAWDDRFNHIGNHFTQEKLRISEWVPLQARGNKTKGELERQRREGTADADEDSRGEEDYPVEAGASDFSFELDSADDVDSITEACYASPDMDLPQNFHEEPNFKRKHSKDKGWRQQSCGDGLTFDCCQCGAAYAFGTLDVACTVSCFHMFCSDCFESLDRDTCTGHDRSKRLRVAE